MSRQNKKMIQEDTHKKILDALPVGIYLCDTNGNVVYINDAYADILEIEKDDILNKNIVDIIPKTRAMKVMESGITEIGDLCVIGDGNHKKTTIVNRIPMTNPAGRVVGMISMCMFSNPNDLKNMMEKVETLSSTVSFYRRRMQSALSPHYTLESILGESPPMTLAKSRLVNYAKTDFPVLVLGQTGTGKELFANALHASSTRRDGPFVSINCAAVPIDLFESELFGYAGGAFSGASKDGKVGLIELADKGTLFLDEIGDMPLAAQAKLLRVLEERTVYRVGSTKPHAVDFRLVAATNRELGEIVRQGSFREDLYYRISALPLQIPSLAERALDIPIIARSLLERMGKDNVAITPEAMQALIAYEWPGNVRELRNALIRAVSVCDGHRLLPGDLPPHIVHPVRVDAGLAHPATPRTDIPRTSLPELRADSEARFIAKAIAECGGNMSKVAKALNISRSTLYEKCRRHGIVKQG
jgi:transcriptional regulator with PAS, ATPase and Fis domain